MRIRRAAIAPCGRMKWRSAKDSNLGHLLKVQLFSRQLPRPPGRAPFMKWLPDVDSHHDEPLNRRSCYFHIIGDLALPAGVAPAWFRLEDGCLWSARPRELKWSRASVLPRVSPRPKRGGLLSSSRASRSCRGNGGLCGHCSRDLPLDRRLLFVAELTGQGGGLCR